VSLSNVRSRVFSFTKQLHPQSWVRNAVLGLLVVCLVIGVFCRFVNLDRKLYWHDENFTSMRISGYHEAQVVQAIRDAGIVDMAYIKQFQAPNPERNVTDTIKALTIDGPQHPPLYYSMAHYWVRVFGGSVTSARAFPVVISLFALPAMYWLLWELFQAPLVGVIGVIFMAVSPFHVLYAQESRQYSLWTVLILVAGAALVRAMRSRQPSHWLIYAISQAALLYTTALSLFVVFSNGVYALFREGGRLTQPFRQFLVAAALGFVAFLPWFYVLITNRGQVNDTLNFGAEKWSINVSDILKSLTRLPGRIFFDLNLNTGDPAIFTILQRLFTPAVLLLTAYAFFYLIRKTSRQVWLFPVTLTGVYGGLMLLQDLLARGQGGGGSTMPRYMVPCFLGIQVAIAYLLGQQLVTSSVPGSQRRFEVGRKFWQGVFAILLTASVVSSFVTTQAQVWWTKGSIGLKAIYPTADYINQTQNPLLLSDAVSWDLLMMSYLLKPETKVLSKPICYVCQLEPEPNFQPDLAQLMQDFGTVFIFPEPTKPFMQWLETQPYRVERVPMGDRVSPNIVLLKLLPK